MTQPYYYDDEESTVVMCDQSWLGDDDFNDEDDFENSFCVVQVLESVRWRCHDTLSDSQINHPRPIMNLSFLDNNKSSLAPDADESSSTSSDMDISDLRSVQSAFDDWMDDGMDDENDGRIVDEATLQKMVERYQYDPLFRRKLPIKEEANNKEEQRAARWDRGAGLWVIHSIAMDESFNWGEYWRVNRDEYIFAVVEQFFGIYRENPEQPYAWVQIGARHDLLHHMEYRDLDRN